MTSTVAIGKGANLFGNSIVAIEAETGKYRWHYQMVRHDTWDFDPGSAPVLIDVTRNGQRIPALAATSKTGLDLHPRSPHGQAALRHAGGQGAAERRAR